MTAGTNGWRYADGMTPPRPRVDDTTADRGDTSARTDVPNPTEET